MIRMIENYIELLQIDIETLEIFLEISESDFGRGYAEGRIDAYEDEIKYLNYILKEGKEN